MPVSSRVFDFDCARGVVDIDTDVLTNILAAGELFKTCLAEIKQKAED